MPQIVLINTVWNVTRLYWTPLDSTCEPAQSTLGWCRWPLSQLSVYTNVVQHSILYVYANEIAEAFIYTQGNERQSATPFQWRTELHLSKLFDAVKPDKKCQIMTSLAFDIHDSLMMIRILFYHHHILTKYLQNWPIRLSRTLCLVPIGTW